MELLDRLEGLVSRYEEVSTLITDPSVIADQKRYVKLTKEYKDLGRIVQARKEYLGLLQNIQDAKEMMAMEDDAETKDMLRQELNDSEPQVLIMHTHETESYEPYTRDFYDSSFTSRTTDDSMNMAAVGDKIAEQLEGAGIGVIHDVTKHDYPSYNGSYDRSRVTALDILAENPSIKVVLDIHRDAIERADGTRIAPTAAKTYSSARMPSLSTSTCWTTNVRSWIW